MVTIGNNSLHDNQQPLIVKMLFELIQYWAIFNPIAEFICTLHINTRRFYLATDAAKSANIILTSYCLSLLLWHLLTLDYSMLY